MKRILLLPVIILTAHISFSQQTRNYTDPQAEFHLAKEYFQKENYSLAYPLFKELELKLREADRTNQALNAQEIHYYTIVCGLKKNEAAAELRAQDYITLEDNAARIDMLNFHLAEYYFRNKDYARALTTFEKVSPDNLSNREIADMKFHQGYSYFTVKSFDKAKPLFDAIRQIPKDPNYIDANYYYGFISFYEKKYADAQQAFMVVQDHPTYS